MPLLQGFSKSRAYLVGISEYLYPIKSLSTPIEDINAIEESLCDFDTITRKIDIKKTDFEIFLAELIREVNDSGTDRVLFYFAGHGTTINNSRGPQGYIILKNERGDENSGNYKIEDLIIQLNRLTCKHLLIVLDCCFAGAVQWDINKRAAGRKNEEQITDPLYRMFTGNNAWQILTSASADQAALNAVSNPVKTLWGDGLRNEDAGNSPFAIQFINALKGVNKEAFFSEKIITTNRLYTYITENLTKDLDEREINHEQVPGLFSLLKHKNGQFIFSFRNEPPELAPTPKFENPYKGFDSYTEKDGDVFFGRDALIADFKKDIKHFSNFFISGPSGIGKSSLIKAGFIPQLLSGSGKKKLHLFRPSTFNFDNSTAFKDELCKNNYEVHIVFFDQFEEVLSLDTNSQKQLSDIIKCGVSSSSIFICIAIRSDKAKRVLENPVFNWSAFKTIVVPFPDSTDIEDIIVKPALRHATIIRAEENKDRNEKEVDIKKDEEFINRIIKAYNEPGSLPFLSTALHEWFDKSVTAEDNQRILKASVWGKSDSIEEVFNSKMKRIEGKGVDKYVFRRLMFRLLDYFESSPVRKQLAIKYTTPDDAPLLKILEDERIIRYPDDREENDPERLIEFAHDSIIEKWLVNQDWFKDRNKKARNNIAGLIRAQNFLVPDVITWQKAFNKKGFLNREKSKRDLWNHEEELPKIQRDIEAVPKKDKAWDHIRNTFFVPAAIRVAPETYFTSPEIDFIQRSAKRNKIGAKIVHRIWILITLMSSVGIALVYRANLKTKREARTNLARSYAERSSNVGETEALYLLKEAEKLAPDDAYIESKFTELLNERDYVGNPFAIAVTKIEETPDSIHWDREKKKLFLYDNLSNTTEWDYTRTSEQRKYIDSSVAKIKTVEKVNNKLIIGDYAMDTIQFQDQAIRTFRISKLRDSIYFITTGEEENDVAIRLYSYSVATKAKKMLLKRVIPEGTPGWSYKLTRHHVYIIEDKVISFYNLSGDSLSSVTNIHDNFGNISFNDQEDKVLLELNTYDDWGVYQNNLELYDFKTGKQTSLPVNNKLDGNYFYKNDSTIIYLDNISDTGTTSNIFYVKYNCNTGKSIEKMAHAPKSSFSSQSLINGIGDNDLLLFDAINSKFIVADSFGKTILNYEGNYKSHQIIHDGSNTLLLIQSTQATLNIFTVFNITKNPTLVHKSSFSLALKKAFCVGNLSLLAMQFENGMFTVFDLGSNLRTSNQGDKTKVSYTGFVEISPGSFVLYSDLHIYRFWENKSDPEQDLRVLNKKGDYLFCTAYDSDFNDMEDSIQVFNCKTDSSISINSDEDKMKYLSLLSGFEFKKSGDSVNINMKSRGWVTIFPDDDFSKNMDGYFKGIVSSENFFFKYPFFINISASNLKAYTPEKDYIFDSSSARRYNRFSRIDMPDNDIVTCIAKEKKSGNFVFLYWNIKTGAILSLQCPERTASYFAIPNTSQILFSDNNKIKLYDFKKQSIIDSCIKKNAITGLFPLSDGLRYLSTDESGNIYTGFLPQKIKEFAYTIKSPDLSYLIPSKL